MFAGPTLYREKIGEGIRRFGPASMGSVFRAVESGYRRVGIVDGYFGNVPSVWHKEILFAIAAGVEVIGAASMGALRAAELSAFGMVGIGRIHRLFRNGHWTDDDEVAVIHATEELVFCPASEAMANIRFTLRRLRRTRAIEPALEKELACRMKSRHFSERTRDALEREAKQLTGEVDGTRFMQRFADNYVDAKKIDALALVDYLTNDAPKTRPPCTWQFPATGHWRKQFESDVGDIPELR